MIPNAADVANAPEARMYSSDIAIHESAFAGYAVRSGCAVSAGSGLAVNVAAGIVYNAKNDRTVAAVTNLSLGSAPTGSNYRWTLIEVDATGAVAIHAGADAVIGSVTPPTPTAGTTVLAAVLIPNGATVVEVFSAGANTSTKTQIIDKRMLGQMGAWLFASDIAQKTLTNQTTLATVLTGTLPQVPANSFQVGELWVMKASLRVTLVTSASALQFQALIGAGAIFDITTDSFNTGANRAVTIEVVFQPNALGVVGIFDTGARVAVSEAGLPAKIGAGAAAAGGEEWLTSATLSAFVDTTTALNLDLKARLLTGNAASTIVLRSFSIVRHPA